MAESHIPFLYDEDQLSSIRAALSEPRFATYYAKAGWHEEYAIALYLYNARLAKAFLFPLHVVEVSLRNAVDRMLVYRFGPAWHVDANLRNGALFTAETEVALEKAISRAEREVNRAGLEVGRGAVVAELTFDFWSNLLRQNYADLWRANLRMVFPNLRNGMKRHDVQVAGKAVNRLRNRVAHHEPLLDVNVPEAMSQIFSLLEWQCAKTASWVRHHTTVSTIVRSRPRAGGSAPSDVGSRLDPGFVQVTHKTSIMEVIERLGRKAQTAVCVDAEGRPVAAFSSLDVSSFIAIDARRNGGLFAADERTVEDLLRDVDATERWRAVAADVALTVAIKHLTGRGVDIVVGLDPDTGAAVGTMQRAHRRY